MGIANFFEKTVQFFQISGFRVSNYIHTHPDRSKEVTALVNNLRRREEYSSFFSRQSESAPLSCMETYLKDQARGQSISCDQAMDELLRNGFDEKRLFDAIKKTEDFARDFPAHFMRLNQA